VEFGRESHASALAVQERGRVVPIIRHTQSACFRRQKWDLFMVVRVFADKGLGSTWFCAN